MFDRWRYRGLLSDAFTLFCRMLEMVGEMFFQTKELMGPSGKPDRILERLRQLEDESDKLHTQIRRKIVEYLSLVPGGDVIAALLLFSAVHDAERLGDLALNIAETMQLVPAGGFEGPYFAEIKEIERRLERMFELTVRAFCGQDEKAAKEAIMMRAPLASACNALLSKIVSDQNILPSRAVCLTLLERYLKRSAAHLYHIAAIIADPRMGIEHTQTPQPPPAENP